MKTYTIESPGNIEFLRKESIDNAVWVIVIDLEGASPFEAGWTKTGVNGMAVPGAAMVSPDGRSIYVRSDRIPTLNGEINAERFAETLYSDWERLERNIDDA